MRAFYFWRGFTENSLQSVSKPLWGVALDFEEKETKEHQKITKEYFCQYAQLEKNKVVTNGKSSKSTQQ